MSAVSCSTASSSGGCGIRFQSTTFASSAKTHSPNFIRIGTNSQCDRFSIHRLELLHGTRKVRGSSIRMALVKGLFRLD
ncbi:hypothetical protein ISN45_Aa06g034930 [Arabidopsis thaliana x Arabidopsis arenosa]|uniref:Uncharacterized protein n=1 Tax=Arabidopsis thaliana x Arabidopsis arenosa TaxID=1240361 RepID=A0A8T1Z243_9BRAS|nr:hypothetical protein ISN45_Aa06g034930 [Arabidopsis thaliana x Arabidopsis arenosa]